MASQTASALDPQTPARADRYLLYLRGLLGTMERARGHGHLQEASSEDGFLTADRQGNLWELICVRLRGNPQLIMGASRFQRHTQQWTKYGRRSLAHYLSSPPRNVGHAFLPASLLELQIPKPSQSIPELLHDFGAGRTARKLLIDTEVIELAFDFRRDNPSLDKGRHPQRTTQKLLMRTSGGHVLSGYAHGLANKLHREEQFFGLTAVRQYTPMRVIPLPTLVVQRSFLSMLCEPEEGEPLEEWLHQPGPFHVANAARHHLLDPRL